MSLDVVCKGVVGAKGLITMLALKRFYAKVHDLLMTLSADDTREDLLADLTGSFRHGFITVHALVVKCKPAFLCVGFLTNITVMSLLFT